MCQHPSGTGQEQLFAFVFAVGTLLVFVIEETS